MLLRSSRRSSSRCVPQPRAVRLGDPFLGELLAGAPQRPRAAQPREGLMSTSARPSFPTKTKLCVTKLAPPRNAPAGSAVNWL